MKTQLPSDRFIFRTGESEKRYAEQQRQAQIRRAEEESRVEQLKAVEREKQLMKEGRFTYQGKTIKVPMGLDLTSKSGWRAYDSYLISSFKKEFGRTPSKQEFRDIDRIATALYEQKYGEASTMGFPKEYKVIRDVKQRVVGIEREVKAEPEYKISGVPVSKGVYEKVKKEGFEILKTPSPEIEKPKGIEVRKGVYYDPETMAITEVPEEMEKPKEIAEIALPKPSPLAEMLPSKYKKGKEMEKAFEEFIGKVGETPEDWTKLKEEERAKKLIVGAGIGIATIPSGFIETGRAIVETPFEVGALISKGVSAEKALMYPKAKLRAGVLGIKEQFVADPYFVGGQVIGQALAFKYGGKLIGAKEPSGYKVTTAKGIREITVPGEKPYYEPISKVTYMAKKIPKEEVGAIIKADIKAIPSASPMLRAGTEISAERFFKITPEMIKGKIPSAIKAEAKFVIEEATKRTKAGLKEGVVKVEPTLKEFIGRAEKVIVEGKGKAMAELKVSETEAFKGEIPMMITKERVIYPAKFEEWKPTTFAKPSEIAKTPIEFVPEFEAKLRPIPSREISVSKGLVVKAEVISPGEIISIGELLEKYKGKRFLLEAEPMYRYPGTPFAVTGAIQDISTERISLVGEKEKFVSRLKPEMAMKTGLEQRLFERQDILSRQIITPIVVPIQAEKQAQKQRQGFEQSLRMRPLQETRLAEREIPKFIPRRRAEDIMIRKRVPEEFIRKPKKVKGFRLLVKKRGKFERVGDIMPYEKALDIGAEIADVKAIAQFKIEPTEAMVRPEKGTGYFARKAYQFRPYKIRRGAKIPLQMGFIERREFRISTPGEKFEITRKGIEAKRRMKWL